jgi:hypothetical protein
MFKAMLIGVGGTQNRMPLIQKLKNIFGLKSEVLSLQRR